MALDQVMVPALDRAFLFGDAVYEVIRVYRGHAWKLEEHFNRLKSSLEAISIRAIDLNEVMLRALTTLKNSSIQEGLIYIQITRGVAKRTHYFPKAAIPNCLIYIEEFDDPYRELRSRGACAITHPDIRWSCNYIKATSLLANCLACQSAIEAGCCESILVDSQGFVTEGSHTSVFAVRHGQILVAPEAANILPGITKRQILNLAKIINVPVTEHRLAKIELVDIDELFLSGTPEEILPITTVDNMPISNGKPGPITRKLHEQFQKTLASWLEVQDNK